MDTLKAFTDWIGTNIDFPAIVMLVLMFMGAYVLHRTQANPQNKFDFADMLRDDNGKPSAFRLGIFVCMALSTWYIMYATIKAKGVIDTYQILGYMAIWSGAKIVETALNIWGARGQPMTLQRTTSTTDTDGNNVVRQVTQTVPIAPAGTVEQPVDNTQVGQPQGQ